MANYDYANDLTEKNVPARWARVSEFLVEDVPHQLDELHPNYRDTLQHVYDEFVNPMTDAAALAEAIDALEIGLGSNPNLNEVTTDLTFPLTGLHGTTVSWDASDHSAISNTGVVTRPANGEGNEEGTVTATVSKGAESDTKTFSVTVLELPE